MGNITIELYYLKDGAGNTIIDREFMIKEMDEEIAKVVEGGVVDFPICYKCNREADSVNDYLYCPKCSAKELDGTLCRNGYPIDDCKCC